MELELLHTKRKRSQPKTIKLDLFLADQNDICPISQEPINDSLLEFLEKNYLIENQPNLKGVILNCNHKFNGIYLLYNWARNKNVLCPVCRGGLQGAYLNVKTIPKHLNSSLMRKVRSERRRDTTQSRQENESIAQRLQYEENLDWLMHFIPENVVFVIEPRHDSNVILMPCDAQISLDDVCSLSTTISEALLASMGEYRIFCSIRSKARSNPSMEIHSRLPESSWFTHTKGNGPGFFFCNQATFCQYSITYDTANGSNAWLKLKTRFSFLKYVSDSHIESIQHS
jgi:hypothetical protein